VKQVVTISYIYSGYRFVVTKSKAKAGLMGIKIWSAVTVQLRKERLKMDTTHFHPSLCALSSGSHPATLLSGG